MMGYPGLGPALVEQDQKRPRSLVTPIPFSVALAASETDIYVGKDDEYFLIRHIAVENTTAGALDLTLRQDSTDWVTAQSIAANTTAIVDGVQGMLLDASADLAGLGSGTGLTVFGWGLRIEGSGDWVL